MISIRVTGSDGQGQALKAINVPQAGILMGLGDRHINIYIYIYDAGIIIITTITILHLSRQWNPCMPAHTVVL